MDTNKDSLINFDELIGPKDVENQRGETGRMPLGGRMGEQHFELP